MYATFLANDPTAFINSANNSGLVPVYHYATFDGTGGIIEGAYSTRDTVYLPVSTNLMLASPPNPVKDGFVFMGWVPSTSSDSTPVTTYTSVNDVTFNAKWGSGYIGVFDANGGQFIDSTTTQTTIGLQWRTNVMAYKPSDPFRDGFTFNGWEISTNQDSVPVIAYPFTSDLTILAIWERNTPPNYGGGGGGGGGAPPAFSPVPLLTTDTTTAVDTRTTVSPVKKPDLPKPVVPAPSPTPNSGELRFERRAVSLGVIYFNTNEYFLDATDRKTISSISMQVRTMQQPVITVEGNTDIKKGVDNVWLSKARAEAVANLLSKDISDNSISVAWYASTRPAVVGLDKQALAKNRRVEIFAIQQLPVAQESTTSKAANLNVSRSFDPITFNRNEYFLDAGDRKALIGYAQEMEVARCMNISVVGTRDATRGGLNETIALLRAKAVADYLKSIDGRLKIARLSQAISNVREAAVSCTN